MKTEKRSESKTSLRNVCHQMFWEEGTYSSLFLASPEPLLKIPEEEITLESSGSQSRTVTVVTVKGKKGCRGGNKSPGSSSSPISVNSKTKKKKSTKSTELQNKTQGMRVEKTKKETKRKEKTRTYNSNWSTKIHSEKNKESSRLVHLLLLLRSSSSSYFCLSTVLLLQSFSVGICLSSDVQLEAATP